MQHELPKRARDEAALAGLNTLRRDFPHWHIWTGVGGLLVYGRRQPSSPPTLKRAADLDDLRQQMTEWEAHHLY
jgi:hypothetical protein